MGLEGLEERRRRAGDGFARMDESYSRYTAEVARWKTENRRIADKGVLGSQWEFCKAFGGCVGRTAILAIYNTAEGLRQRMQ